MHAGIGGGGVRLRGFVKRRGRSLQVALEKQADSVIVPALPFLFFYNGLRRRSRRIVRDHGQRNFVLGDRDDGQIGDLFLPGRNSLDQFGEYSGAIIVVGSNVVAGLLVGVSDKRELRSKPRELAIAESRVESDFVSGVLRNRHAIV